MSTFTREALEIVLETHSFETLIGKVENDWFDAKEQPYDVSTPRGKRELAKDMVAFANSLGGFVLIGLRTVKSASSAGDEVAEVRLLPAGLVDPEQYRNILREWVYPQIEGFAVDWLPTPTDTSRGLVALRVPQQREVLRPFLVAKTVDDHGKMVEVLFGYCERRGDMNDPMDVRGLQAALRTGLNFDRTLNERLGAIEAAVRTVSEAYATRESDTAAVPPVPPSAPSIVGPSRREVLDSQIECALAESDFGDERSAVLVARPSISSELRTIFTSSEDSIRRKLERPPVLRDAGWDLETRGYAEIVRGQLIRVRGYQKILDLYRDGTLVFACVANDDFLAWTSREQKLHPLALVEVFYNFFNFYGLVLADLRTIPDSVDAATAFRNLHRDNLKTRLGPGGMNAIGQMFPDMLRAAPDDATTIEKNLPAQPWDPGRAAFDMVREVYLWFGLEEDKIPYAATTAEGYRVIDPAAIRRA